MSGIKSQRNWAGDPAPGAALGACLPCSPGFIKPVFVIKPLWSVLSCARARAAFQKKHFQVESRLGIPPRMAPWACPCFPAVKHTKTWNSAPFSSRIDTKMCFKGTSCTCFPLPSPRPKLSIQNSPCGRWEQRLLQLLWEAWVPNLKLFTPFWCPVPSQWHQSYTEALGCQCSGSEKWFIFWSIFADSQLFYIFQYSER